MRRLAALAVLIFLALAACTPAGRLAAVHEGFDVALCVATHQDEPLDQVIARCIRDNVTPADIAVILARQRGITDRAAMGRTCQH